MLNRFSKAVLILRHVIRCPAGEYATSEPMGLTGQSLYDSLSFFASKLAHEGLHKHKI
jgi:hypothetical protein